MKTIKWLKTGIIQNVTSRYAQILIAGGLAVESGIEVKEEKQAVETKEDKIVKKRQTKKR